MTSLRSLHLAAAGLALATAVLGSSPAWGQAFPARPLKIIHGGGPGGNGDLMSRSAAAPLGDRLGQTVVVEPKPGAGQNIAMAAVAHGAADGYTLALLNAGISVQAALNSKLSYDLRRDFAPIGMVSSFPVVFVVRADSAYKTIQGLLESARQQPGKLSFGAIGGTTQHLTGELFATTANIRWTHVPYTGSAGPLTDLMGGRLDVVVDSLTALMSQIQAGKVRALAVSSAKRWPMLPEVPALAETLPGFDVTSWTGLAVPTATPAAVRERLERELAAIVTTDAFAAQVRQFGSEPYSLGAAEMKRFIDGEVERWNGVARKAGIALN